MYIGGVKAVASCKLKYPKTTNHSIPNRKKKTSIFFINLILEKENWLKYTPEIREFNELPTR